MTAEIPSLGSVARRPSVVVFLVATFVLEVGITSQFTALGKRVFDISGHESDLGLLGLAEFLPVALLVLLTGAVADRFPRQRVAALALAGEAAFSVALIAEVKRSDASIGPIFGLVVGYAVARAFLSPAIRALPSTIVEPHALPRMNSLYIGTFQAGVIAGPVIGALLYTIDVWVPFAVAAACLGVGAVLVATVRVDPVYRDAPAPARDRATGGRLTEALQGLKVIRREPLLLGAISLDLFAVLFGGAVALLPAVAEKRLHVGVVGLGWLRAAAGMGAAFMTVVLAVRPVRRRVGATLFGVVGLFGAGTLVLGFTHTYAVAFVALVVLSGADSVSVFIRSTLVPLVTPNEVRGRVGAVENVFIGASNELGAFESGTLGQLIGAGPAIMAGGAATIAIVVVWPILFPAIRRLDRFPFHHGAVVADPESIADDPDEIITSPVEDS
ncbi:MAG: MFS transporter [Acidimicrobiales bacterium]